MDQVREVPHGGWQVWWKAACLDSGAVEGREALRWVCDLKVAHDEADLQASLLKQQRHATAQ